MDIERAFAIVHGINCGCYAALDIKGNAIPSWLADVSLAEMIEAVNMVTAKNQEPTLDENGSRCFTIVPDQRLVAAVFTLLHYEPDADLIAAHGHKAVVVVRLRPAQALPANSDETADEKEAA